SPLRHRIPVRVHEHRLIRTQNCTLRRRIELGRYFHAQKRPNSPIRNRHDSLRHPGPAQRRLRRRTIWQDRNRAPTQTMRHTLQPPPSIKISASHNLIRQIQNELLHRLRSPTRNSHTSSSPPTVRSQIKVELVGERLRITGCGESSIITARNATPYFNADV